MKRYWKLLFSSLFSLIILGTFYVYMNFPDRGLPHFEIETVEGNKKEVEKLILNGDWIQDNDDQYYPFILTVAETTYLHEQSFFTQLTNLSWSPPINYYISEYRNFMRGKDLDPSVYFENEEYLAYGTVGHEYYQGINNFFFEIALLDKNTNENISFTVDVPNTENYRWLNSYHVELINDQLKIFTINQLNDSEREELHVYVFDWNNESLVSSEKLLSAPVIDNGWSHLTIFNNIDHIGSEKYLLVKSEAYQENLLNDGGINKPVSVEFLY